MKTVSIISYAILLLFLVSPGKLAAQQYGGSAYAYVEDDDGKTRCINVTAICENSSESSAKSSLELDINYLKRVYEHYVRAIEFDIDSCDN